MTDAATATIPSCSGRRVSGGPRRPKSVSLGLLFGLQLLVVGGPVAAEGPEREAARNEPSESGKQLATTPRPEHDARSETDSEARETWSPALYVPPSRGQARHTAAGGTRGRARSGSLELAVLAPVDHVAFTTLSQPRLYWYVSESVVGRIDVTLVDDEAIDPLLEFTVPGPVGPGIHELDLAEHGIELEAGRAYRWHVALVRDETRRSNDLLTEGFIERRPESAASEGASGDALDAAFEGASGRAVADLAQSGIWYDAIARLRAEIAAHPQDAHLRRQQAALLEQVELGGVARRVREIDGETGPSEAGD